MTKWKDDFIAFYRKQEEQHRLTPTPQKVLDLIAGLGEDVVNGKSREHSVAMLVGMLTNARDPLPVLGVLNESDSQCRAEREAARQVAAERAAHGDASA